MASEIQDDLTQLVTSPQIKSILATQIHSKALPSQPIWTQMNVDYGYWDGDRAQLLKLAAYYQNIPEVHGAIDINAKAASTAKPTLMKRVNKGAKNLTPRKLKRLSVKRYKRLMSQWNEPNLHRKSIGDEEELVEVTSHPVLDALHSNDQDQNFSSLLRLTTIAFAGVFGICFWLKVRDSLGKITSYQYLPTYNVSPQRGSDGRINGWYYASTYGDAYAEQLWVDKDDIVVTRWPSISDPHAGGDSPLKAALKKIDISGKWDTHQDWILNNRARPDAILTVADEMGGDLAIREEKRLNDKFRGPGQGRILVTPGKFNPVSYPLTDLASLKFGEALRDAIFFVLGIPKSFSTNDSNKATMAASMDQWARQSLAPIISMLESTLNGLVKDFDEDESLFWVFENVIPEDREQELEEETFELSKWTAALKNGAITDDEYREHVLGLDPKPIDETPEPIPVPTIDQQVKKEPEEEEIEEAESIATDKSFDLLALNRQVAAGFLDRATAINVVAYSLKIDQAEAKSLVTKVKRKSKTDLNHPDSVPRPVDNGKPSCPECTGEGYESYGDTGEKCYKCMKCGNSWSMGEEKPVANPTNGDPAPATFPPKGKALKIPEPVKNPDHKNEGMGTFRANPNCCDICAALDGKPWSKDDYLPHPNCKCMVE
jgi:phage portal protein BeeE